MYVTYYKSQHAETLHTKSDALIIQCVVKINNILKNENFQAIKMILCSSHFLNREAENTWSIQSFKQDKRKERFIGWSCGIIPTASKSISGCQWSSVIRC